MIDGGSTVLALQGEIDSHAVVIEIHAVETGGLIDIYRTVPEVRSIVKGKGRCDVHDPAIKGTTAAGAG